MQGRITPAMGNAKEFEKHSADVREEAQLLAILSEVIQREAYDYWDDEKFRAHADELRAAMKELSKAAGESNYDAARTSAGRAGQACVACHEEFRG